MKQSKFNKLICPRCGSDVLSKDSKQFKCNKCLQEYPLYNEIPLLFDQNKSLFTYDGLINHEAAYFKKTNPNKIKDIFYPILFGIDLDIGNSANFDRILEQFPKQQKLSCLILGGSVLSIGIQKIYDRCHEVITSDISFSRHVDIIFDCHNIPYTDNRFDIVIVEAVLEHVINPQMVVNEIHRVLRKDGIVYAEIPFMQQVHGGAYDFQRFTYTGILKLFSDFEEIQTTVIGGPGLALCWSYKYFLLTFFENKKTRRIVEIFANLTSFPLRWVDYILCKKEMSMDAASAFSYLAKRSLNKLEDKSIVRKYIGGFK
jgi:SAM-dependent methyltransferase